MVVLRKKNKDAKLKIIFVLMILFSYLSECWINNTCDIEIDDFICKSVPLSRKKHKQGCGIYVMIRKSIAKYVKIMDILYDTLV